MESFKHPKILFLTLSLSMLLASLGTSITNVALPILAKEWNVSMADVQWLTLAYLFSVTVFTLLAGRFGDLLGKRKVFIGGLFLYAISAFGCALSANLGVLIFSRFLQGVGAAALMTLTIALMSEVSETKKLGRSMGLLATMSAIGTAAGPSVGGFLIAISGWRAGFYLMGLLAILNVGFAYRFIPKVFTLSRERKLMLDRKESVLSFIYLIFSDQNLRRNLISNAVVSTVMMTTLVVGPFYLSWGLKLNAATVGLVMSVGPLASILSGFPAGRMADRYGSKLMLLFGLGGMILGTAALAVLPTYFHLTGYLFAVLILSPSYQLFQASNSSSIMGDVASESRGTISGLLNVSRNVGLIMGASIMSQIFHYACDFKNPEDVGLGIIQRAMMLTFGFAMLLALITFLVQVRERIFVKAQAWRT